MSMKRAVGPRTDIEATVLIVDDDPATVERLKAVFRQSSRALEVGRAGAFYFIEKSDPDPKGLRGLPDRAADLVDERRQHLWLQERMREQYSFENILRKSKPMLSLFQLANAVHHRSHRAQGPFIKIHCAALPRAPIDSELFGYKKSAFTGATTDTVGLLELARGGSLMLDEIQPQDLPASIREEAASASFSVPPRHTLAEIERLTILQTLQRTNRNTQEAANILGLHRPILYSKMRRHDISDPRSPTTVVGQG